MAAIDVDSPGTWPEATREWVSRWATQLAGTAQYTSDLSVRLLEQEHELRATFREERLLAYHCTRLLPHEVETIRDEGLRPLDRTSLEERLTAAVEHGSLPPAAREYAESQNIYSVGNLAGRERQLCFVLGRAALDEDAVGCAPLLTYWGGEAMRGGPADAPPLAGIGEPTIIVAQLDFATSPRRSRTHPGLGQLFVGTMVGTARACADVFYGDAVPPEDILAVWQPGNAEYDRHAELPRGRCSHPSYRSTKPSVRQARHAG